MDVDCCKTKYNTDKQARANINKIKRISGRRMIPRRAYRCNRCGYRHITHEEYISKKQRS